MCVGKATLLHIFWYIFVPADEVGRGHGDGDCPSVRSCVRQMFLTIIRKSNHSVNFKFGVCICCMGVHNWFAFGRHWPNFGHLVAIKRLKMGQNGGLRPLSETVFTQSNSNLVCTFIGLVFRTDSLSCYVSQILILYLTQSDSKWFPPIIWKKITKSNSTWSVHLLGECSELTGYWVTMAKFWPASDHKITENGGFRSTIIWKSIPTIQVKLGMYIYWMRV